MAVRIEFFSIDGTIDFEVVGDDVLDGAVGAFDSGATVDGPTRCVGWMSASDDDEQAFSGWCEAVDEDLGIGLLLHGLGESSGLPVARLRAEVEPQASWDAVLGGALGAGAGGRLGWRTHFDAGGTVGTDDDFPTESHPSPS